MSLLDHKSHKLRMTIYSQGGKFVENEILSFTIFTESLNDELSTILGAVNLAVRERKVLLIRLESVISLDESHLVKFGIRCQHLRCL